MGEELVVVGVAVGSLDLSANLAPPVLVGVHVGIGGASADGAHEFVEFSGGYAPSRRGMTSAATTVPVTVLEVGGQAVFLLPPHRKTPTPPLTLFCPR